MYMDIDEPGGGAKQTAAAGTVPHVRAVGIDLGTTNSVVAIVEGKKVHVLEDADGTLLTPSVVHYDLKTGQSDCGHAAMSTVGAIHSVKRLMGKGAEEIDALSGQLPYDIVQDASDDSAPEGMARLRVGETIKSPVEISADLLRYLKKKADVHLGYGVHQAVITVPAYFDDAARAATKDAAQLAGLEVLRLVNEPTAAALAYGLDQGSSGHFAVYDLGGGTFDISILRLESGVFQVLATGGDDQLGGDDFDHILAEHFLKQGVEASLDKPLSTNALRSLLLFARGAKEHLTVEASFEGTIDLEGSVSKHTITSAEFETLTTILIDRTITLVKDTIRRAQLQKDDLQGIVLVGGATRMHHVRTALTTFFGRAPLDAIDPDLTVAHGAALQADALTGGRDDMLLLDVNPLSLGIETMGGLVEKIIERNTPIPAQKKQTFTTYQDGQSAMAIHVLQGERETVDGCRSLARIELKGIPPMTAGAARIDVSFSVDADGLLTVSAQEQTTGVKQVVEVKPSYGLSQEAMRQLIEESHIHGKEDIKKRLLIQQRVEAERVLKALESAITVDGHLLEGDERSRLEDKVGALKKAIQSEDREAIKMLVEALEALAKPFAERRVNHALQRAVHGVDLAQFARGLET